MSTRKEFQDYLLRLRPEWARACACGEQILDYLDQFELVSGTRLSVTSAPFTLRVPSAMAPAMIPTWPYMEL